MMPPAASRLTLVVSALRVKPLHAISADRAEREGLWRGKARRHLFWHDRGAWDQNPLVAVIDFTVEHRNVDEMCEAECLDGAA
jgi:hypothetical protein